MPMSTLDETEQRGIFGLFKGESGEGKTVGALSFPTPYIMDFDKKMPAIGKKHFPGKDIKYDTPKTIFEASDILESLIDNCPYETVINDSITSLVVMTLNAIGDTKGEKVIEMLKKTSKGGNIELMGIDYYNGETNFIQRYWIERLKALWARPGNPKHVITIAHVLTVESAPDLKTKVITTTRSIVTAGRKVAAYIPTQFDEAYHFCHKQGDAFNANSRITRIVLTENDGTDYAKTAYRLPKEIDFTDKSLYDEMKKFADI